MGKRVSQTVTPKKGMNIFAADIRSIRSGFSCVYMAFFDTNYKYIGSTRCIRRRGIQWLGGALIGTGLTGNLFKIKILDIVENEERLRSREKELIKIHRFDKSLINVMSRGISAKRDGSPTRFLEILNKMKCQAA